VCNECAISKKHITHRRQCLNHDRLYHHDILDGKRSKKKQRSSLECQEVSIHDATEMQHDFTMYTYPIAIGSDSISHEKVEAKFALELNEFRLGKTAASIMVV